MREDKEQLRVTVKQARVGVGLSQATMANLLDISYNRYRHWEERPALINVENAKKIAKICKLTIDDIIFF